MSARATTMTPTQLRVDSMRGPRAAAIVMLLTWLYLSAYVFLFGAELNAELEHQTMKDSTTGHPEPLGGRGAWAADHVAGLTDDGTSEGPSLGQAGPPSPAKDTVKEQEAEVNDPLV